LVCFEKRNLQICTLCMQWGILYFSFSCYCWWDWHHVSVIGSGKKASYYCRLVWQILLINYNWQLITLLYYFILCIYARLFYTYNFTCPGVDPLIVFVLLEIIYSNQRLEKFDIIIMTFTCTKLTFNNYS
jgi:hypothetical protein